MTKRIYWLDLLKFTLSILIVFHHFQQVTGTAFEKVNFSSGAIYIGYVVEFFFMISGFVIGSSIEKTKKQTMKAYILKKAIRLYPMVWISNAVLVLCMVFYRLYFGNWWKNDIPTFWRTINSFLLTFQGGAVPNMLGLNNPSWYLCVLLMCYTVFYGICWLSNKANVNCFWILLWFQLISLGGYFYSINLPFFNGVSQRGYIAFFGGVVLRLVYDYIEKKKATLFMSIYFALVVAYIILDFETYCADQWVINVFGIFPSCIILLCSLDSIISNKMMGMLGQISFEIYLWHYCGILVLDFLHGLINTYETTTYTMGTMIMFVVCMIVFSAIIYYMIERPVTNKLLSLHSEKSC